MKIIGKFLDHWWWLFYGLIPAIYLSTQSAFYSYKYNFFPDFIFIYVISILFLLVAFLLFRVYAKYYDVKKGKLTILRITSFYFTFPLLSSCVVAFFLFTEFKSLDNNAIFPDLFSYLLIQLFLTVLFLCIGYCKEEKQGGELAEFEKKQEQQLFEAPEKNEIIESQRIENETLRARIDELENQLQNQSAVNSEQVLEYDGDLPAGTNEDKLAYFFELIIDPALLNDGGEMPTYSQLHTRLNHKHKTKAIPSKNTIKKYLNQ